MHEPAYLYKLNAVDAGLLLRCTVNGAASLQIADREDPDNEATGKVLGNCRLGPRCLGRFIFDHEALSNT